MQVRDHVAMRVELVYPTAHRVHAAGAVLCIDYSAPMYNATNTSSLRKRCRALVSPALRPFWPPARRRQSIWQRLQPHIFVEISVFTQRQSAPPIKQSTQHTCYLSEKFLQAPHDAHQAPLENVRHQLHNLQG
jgi:hypothetical protein